MTGDYSVNELLKFLDYLRDKGLMNKGTVVARKAASNNMLSILGDGETSDIRKIDLDELATRFGNLKGAKYTPNSLQVYKSRLSKARDDFIRYKDNPANFTVGVKPRQRGKAGNLKPSGISSSGDNDANVNVTNPITETQKNVMNIPIAIRPGCIIQLNGIPTDLTKSEAQKIAAIIVANAIVEE